MSEIGVIFLLIIRVLAANYCTSRARLLNRNVLGWGIFGFVSPLLACLWIKGLRTKTSQTAYDDASRPFDQM